MAWKSAWVFSWAVALAAVACSSDDHELGGDAGASGQGGSGAGASGGAGRGGSSAGSGGSTTGGGAGAAGSAGKGNAGASGSAGEATSGGSAGEATSGGSAGEATSGGSAGEATSGGSAGTGEAGGGGTDDARRCLESGGTVTTSLCCGSVDAFPNTCAIGACGCSPANSHEVPSCECPRGGCFDGERCI